MSVQMQNKNKRQHNYRDKHTQNIVQSYAGVNELISSFHINKVFKRWNESPCLGIQQKATSAMKTLFTDVPHISYSLQKERWCQYMYRIIEINDNIYNIYRFNFK